MTTTTPTHPALRVLVVDDEQMAQKRLVRLCGELASADPPLRVEVVGECGDGAQALLRLKQGGVDVVLLDIHMPGLSGLEAAELLSALPQSAGAAIVFVTAYADHAVDAFALGACDYLLKPVDAPRLHKALLRAQARTPAPAPAAASSSAALLPRLAVPTRKGVVLLDPHTVSHCVLQDGLVTVFAAGQPPLLTDFALSDLEERLPADRFVRVHRNALVNLAQVRRLDPIESGGYVARLDDRGDHDVVVSRAAARELRRRLMLREA